MSGSLSANKNHGRMCKKKKRRKKKLLLKAGSQVDGFMMFFKSSQFPDKSTENILNVLRNYNSKIKNEHFFF